jgi:hypothetical protein
MTEVNIWRNDPDDFYPVVLRGSGSPAPELRVKADGSVEFINFKPDPCSQELFEVFGKAAAQQQWRATKAG